MKTVMQVIALVLLCTGLSVPTFAQEEVTPESPVIDLDFTFSPPEIPVQPTTTQGVTEIPQPLVLKHPKNGKCYAFRCDSEAGCTDCALLWKDRNGDGKINPRKELRCRCKADPDKECRMKVKQVACKD